MGEDENRNMIKAVQGCMAVMFLLAFEILASIAVGWFFGCGFGLLAFAAFAFVMFVIYIFGYMDAK